MTLDDLRLKIDSIDNTLLELYNERMELVHAVGELKNTTGAPIYRPEREQAILNRLKSQNKGKLTDNAIDALFLEMFAVARNLELPESIAFLGPEASFTHQAAESKFGAMSKYIPMGSIQSIFREVNKGTAKFGVIPIENSSNGIVSDTINCLDEYDLKIIAEVMIDVHFAFATLSEDIKKITKIYSKDIAFGQCRLFLQDLGLDDVELIPVESTAKAAKLAVNDETAAALCPALAAKLNNLPIRFDNIEDNTNNKTRFFIISNFENISSGDDKTSMLVRLSNQPGSLVDFLNHFEGTGINLTKIKSHIVGGESIFFIEFHGHKDDTKVKGILDTLYSEIKILGSYVRETDDV
ncbi:MAG: Chorismate mutase I (EC / Prephenate dehydratase (EC [uncultured Sulfurovum sp.]|uniref:Bifunctional chorismate mutase/prephenate dehydratase n=1 Tax=uncultured Sulfurovum sp. TaxID=269237 RepID=A0A6S6THU5_9BACT|nr:MAG: Chorismate mutase I (EC / Prephenate dehydratase (EC [uncultured Sulfurovum sp.]